MLTEGKTGGKGPADAFSNLFWLVCTVRVIMKRCASILDTHFLMHLQCVPINRRFKLTYSFAFFQGGDGEAKKTFSCYDPELISFQ